MQKISREGMHSPCRVRVWLWCYLAAEARGGSALVAEENLRVVRKARVFTAYIGRKEGVIGSCVAYRVVVA